MNKLGMVVVEFIIFGFVAGLIYVMYSNGISYQQIQFVTVLMLVAIVLPLKLEAAERKIAILNAKSIVLVGTFFWVLLDALRLREGIEIFPPEIILQVFLEIMLFFVMIFVSYIIPWPGLFAKIFKDVDYGNNFNDKKLIAIVILCFFLGFLPVILWGGGFDKVMYALTHAGRWNAKWGRARFGGVRDYLNTALSIFLGVALQLSWFCLLFLKKRKSVILYPFIFFGLWVVFNTGTRNYLLGMLIPLIMLYYLDSWNKKKNKFFLLFVVAYLFLALAQFQLIVRDSPSNKTIAEVAGESLAGILETNPTEHHRDDQLFQLLKYAQFVPSSIPHSGEWVIFRPFYHFIPRFLWKGKPEGITRFFEQLTNDPGTGMTTFAGSIVGDFYLCQGWFGVVLAGLLMGFLAKQFDSLIDMSRHSPAVLFIYGYGIVFLFVSIRSYQIIYEGWYGFIVFYWVLKSIRRKRPQFYNPKNV